MLEQRTRWYSDVAVRKLITDAELRRQRSKFEQMTLVGGTMLRAGKEFGSVYVDAGQSANNDDANVCYALYKLNSGWWLHRSFPPPKAKHAAYTHTHIQGIWRRVYVGMIPR